jgi:hypothetical protein
VTLFLKLAATSAALALCLGASAASATIVTATYTGSITGTTPQGDPGAAFDKTGVFGSLMNLDTQDFTATFVFDTNLGQRATIAGQDQLVGGAIVGLASPFLSASLTIEGVTHAFQSDVLGFALVVTDGAHNATLHLVESGFDFLSAGLQNPALPLDLTVPFSGDYSLGDPASPTVGEFLISDGTNPVAHGYLDASHLTITASAAPEPAAWGLMLMGFGGLGAMARRARRGSPASATS